MINSRSTTSVSRTPLAHLKHWLHKLRPSLKPCWSVISSSVTPTASASQLFLQSGTRARRCGHARASSAATDVAFALAAGRTRFLHRIKYSPVPGACLSTRDPMGVTVLAGIGRQLSIAGRRSA
ncbi:hypothetical protein HYPSUDRAFT_974008 [Hypholoma sublateritium FD-334 SS-4]|uniref:Uncharacterized protein n=1 Tax=Hypholoma sublateritium (strain FD-334 SS-4) TaxID=945553 RepID=A0A0D2NG83_HYPSF|nr:hypothetical protein HYPSUDRAFT_974008 [Hypholoma sublateritium FD-334 SS-4]